MSESAVVETAAPAAVATPSGKKKSVGSRKPKAAPSHPKVSEMVKSAITTLKERGGSSLQAIKKHIGSHYSNVDVEKLAPFIKKYLKNGVATGALVQTKGKGATGSFKLGSSGEKKESSSSGAGGKAAGKKKASAKAAPKKKPKAQVSSAKKSKPKKPKEASAKKKSASPAKKAAVSAAAKKKSAAPKKPKAQPKKLVKASKPKASPKKAAKKSTPKKAAKK